jgi:phenolic acid decarboxylase
MNFSKIAIAAITLFLFSCENENVYIEESPASMNGTEMTYQYSEGNAYNLKFDNDSVSYRFLTGPKPEAWWGPFKYNASKKTNGEYFLSWYEHGYGDYITLLIEEDRKTLMGSGVYFKNNQPIIHFQKAIISEFTQTK